LSKKILGAIGLLPALMNWICLRCRHLMFH